MLLIYASCQNKLNKIKKNLLIFEIRLKVFELSIILICFEYLIIKKIMNSMNKKIT